MLNHFETLCNLCAVSGDEQAVRSYLISVLEKRHDVTWTIDPLGSLLVEKRGQNRAPHKLMVSAHMDEVGMIVTHVNSDGTLCIQPVGGVDASVAIGRQVLVGEKHLPGVVGAKPIHLLSPEERKALPKWSGLVLDIGADNAEQARAAAPEGTYAYFAPDFVRMGKDRICSKAIDDRAGCAILLHLLEQDAPYDFTAAFLVQEEVGLRGAKAGHIQLTRTLLWCWRQPLRQTLQGQKRTQRFAVWAAVRLFRSWIAAPFMTRSCTAWHFHLRRKTAFPARQNPGSPAETTAVRSTSAVAACAPWQFPCRAAICIHRPAWQI